MGGDKQNRFREVCAERCKSRDLFKTGDEQNGDKAADRQGKNPKIAEE